MNPIRHIEFWRSDLARSMEFYGQILGLLGWSRHDANGFACDGTKLYFRERKEKFEDALGPRHICFQAEDQEAVDKVAKLLEVSNVAILHGPEVLHPHGSYMLVFKDPDGYILEIACKP